MFAPSQQLPDTGYMEAGGKGNVVYRYKVLDHCNHSPRPVRLASHEDSDVNHDIPVLKSAVSSSPAHDKYVVDLGRGLVGRQKRLSLRKHGGRSSRYSQHTLQPGPRDNHRMTVEQDPL